MYKVERAAKQQGQVKRTLDRARSQLYVQRLPPNTFRGPWRIALQNDAAVAAYRKRKEEKNQKARQRNVNGRKQKRNRSIGKRGSPLLAPAR